jgi:urea carboxylase
LYLGARATFALGQFGGHAVGCLRTGDTLRIGTAPVGPREPVTPPVLTHDWEIGVLYGPHGAPDFFQDADIADLFGTAYEVHYNSARTGVRLIGPKPRWARADGGEAGLHPSNIHDNAYAIGAIDFTGDMPIILGPDGPSLGGFVCPAVVVRDELWKLGQLRPGDRVRFRRLSLPGVEGPVLRRVGEGDGAICYRLAGDSYLLVEFGPLVLDIALRLRAQLVMERLRAEGLAGIIDLVPGIRSLQIHYDRDVLTLGDLMAALQKIEAALTDVSHVRVPGRIVHLPLSWDDEQARLAMTRYQELVRPNAPWCPSNIEFIRRINGLDSIEAVKEMIFAASYLVLGLGDVYLGAPVATPLDPRHRLVTTKYNPARTWTPENAVGIGGAYLCVYGMEGAATSCLAARSRCGIRGGRRRSFLRPSPGCCASSTRSASIPSPPRNFSTPARDFRRANTRSPSRRRSSISPPISGFWPTMPRASRLFVWLSARLSRPSVSAGGRRAWTASRRKPRPLPRRMSRWPMGWSRSSRPCPAMFGRCLCNRAMSWRWAMRW